MRRWVRRMEESIDMYIIVGLGNPRAEYENTRHNIGFDVIDFLAKKYDISVSEQKFKALIGKGMIEREKVVLVKPLTFMNLSGESVREVCNYFKVEVEKDLIVISDDVSLAEGMIRIRKKGSAGGHNGLKNIIMQIGTDSFQRIKMGVGEKPKGYDLADYVLGHFLKKDREIMDRGIEDASSAIQIMLTEGIDSAMNKFNKKNSEA